MGGIFSSWFSSIDESKKIENEGQINNSVVVEESVEIYNFEIILMLLIIVILKIIEFLFFIYRTHDKRMKKSIKEMLTCEPIQMFERNKIID
jgi:hypothetical protein